jgi:hypothetical protein
MQIRYILLGFILAFYTSKPDRPYSEFWELKSLKKTGGHRIEVYD